MLFLQQNLLGNALQQWLIAIGIAVAVIMAVGLIRSLAVRRLATLASRTANSIDDLIVLVVRTTHLLLVWLPVFWIAGQSLELTDRRAVLLKGTAAPAVGPTVGVWVGG